MEGEREPKYIWVHLRKRLEASDWRHCDIQHSNGESEWRFDTSFSFEPELNKKNCGRDFDDTIFYRYYHRKLNFVFSFSSTNKSSHIKVKTCLLWRDYDAERRFEKEVKSRSEGHPCNTEKSASYGWFFDRAVITMQFKGKHSGGDGLTKRFHVEAESGSCKEDCHLHESRNEVASFVEPLFVPIDELEAKCEYSYGESKLFYLPTSIEILVRVHLSKWSYNGVRVAPDDYCTLDRVNFQSVVSTNRSKRTMFHHASSGLKLGSSDGDVCFKIGPNLENSIRAHRLVLGFRSPVLRKMLFDVEMEEKICGEIHLPGVSCSALKAFLECLYSHNDDEPLDHLNLNVEQSFEVLKLAHMYQVLDLVEFCISDIISHPNSDFTLQQAVDMYILGDLYEIQDLKYRCMQWIKRNKSKTTSEELKKFLKSANHELAIGFILGLLN